MELKHGETTKIYTIDALCAITHPVRQYMRIDFLDFTRINGRFVIPSSKLLNLGVVLAIWDCIGNTIKCAAAIQSGNVTKAQEIFAVFGMALVMTMRGFSLARNRIQLSKLLNDLDCIFPHSAFLQAEMEVEKCHRFIRKRFFTLHTIMTTALVPFCFMPLGKFFFLYEFEEKPAVSDDFHVNASWMPFGLKDRFHTFAFIYAYEVGLAITAVNMVITWDHVFVITISQLCMYYEYLAKLLEKIDVREANDPQKEDEFFKQLHLYIYIHQYLNGLAHDINNIFNLSILISHMASAMSICFNLFLISDAEDYLSMATYLAPCLVEIWLLYDVSKWGTLLETVTSRINEVLYEQKWYESSIRFGKYTKMWMQGTNEPSRLTAFNMFNVNMKHFQDMMMLAYQMLTFMKSKS